MKLAVVLLLSFAFFLSQINAQPPRYVSFDYDETQFLRQKIDYDVCIMVPNPPSMKMVSPSDYVPKDTCSQGKFFGYVLLSILPSLIMCALVLFCFVCCCPCFCALRYGKGFFGGGRPTAMNGVRGTILPGNQADALRARYSRPEIGLNKACLGILFIGLIAGGGLVIVSTQMLSTFIWQAKDIFEQNPIYAINTVYAVNQSLSAINYTQTTAAMAVTQDSMDIAYKLQSTAQEEITDKLDGLSTIVQVVLDATVGAIWILLIFSIYTAMFHRPKCAIFIILLLTPILFIIWVEFSIVFAANNIINEMCKTINTCHFCWEGQYPPNNNGSVDCHNLYCNVPWFNAMSNCTQEDASRFYGLQDVIVNATTEAAQVTCGQIGAICNDTTDVQSCIFPNGECNSTTLQAASLNGIVAIELKAQQSEWHTVSWLANNDQVSPALSSLASDAVDQYEVVQTYAGLLVDVEMLDCSQQSITPFIESDGGTFDALQKHLCPKTNHPERTIDEILVLLAIGFLILAMLVPCVQCALFLGDKRFRRRIKAVNTDDDGEERTPFVRSINTTMSPPGSRSASIFD